MAEETLVAEPAKVPRNRRLTKKKASRAKKNPKKPMLEGIGPNIIKVKKIDGKMKKLFRKRAREYNSDEDNDNDSMAVIEDDESSELEEVAMDNGASDDEENDEILPGITKFVEGCRAFRIAFRSIIKKSVTDDSLVSYLAVWFLFKTGSFIKIALLCRVRCCRRTRSSLEKSLQKRRLRGRSRVIPRRKSSW